MFWNDYFIKKIIIIIIISLLMSHCWGTGLPYGLLTRRTIHNPPRGPSVDWWVLTTANATGNNVPYEVRKSSR
jgi:hypothetical protein